MMKSTQWLTHDQLAFCVLKIYPELICGKDFWTSHPIERNQLAQTGPAIIAIWDTEVTQPTIKQIRRIWARHFEECLLGEAELNAAQTKLTLLAIANQHVNDYQDLIDIEEATDSDLKRQKEWKKFRANLNRVNQQNGWPLQPEWPQQPDDHTAR
ncbi:XkdW family protein [Glaciimonas immobilis]|uniref:Bacteriophage SP-beta YorD domain-containing protein n=1 Tax=Glaciimonas immobilis TaxID=728004 RepID=A0A840RLZ1_9BURK|nr:tail fiber assembly protein [Glaciimonas immobilis]KAF3999217.1 tail fiber assembly protein [Glaciimonas immobilis]MBB5198675.1 hypothetical protein [Glaciimonas immobilis]